MKSQSISIQLPIAILLTLLSITLLVCHYSPALSVGDQAGLSTNLPEKVGIFVSQPIEPSEAEKRLLPPDTINIKRLYYTDFPIHQRDVISTGIVLSSSDPRSIHRPEICLTGQNWNIVSSREIIIPIDEKRSLPVRDIKMTNSFADAEGNIRTVTAHYFYWFVGKDRITTSHGSRVFTNAMDNLLRNVNHRWAYPNVLCMVTDAPGHQERQRTDDETVQMMIGFIKDWAPTFQTTFIEHQ